MSRVQNWAKTCLYHRWRSDSAFCCVHRADLLHLLHRITCLALPLPACTRSAAPYYSVTNELSGAKTLWRLCAGCSFLPPLRRWRTPFLNFCRVPALVRLRRRWSRVPMEHHPSPFSQHGRSNLFMTCVLAGASLCWRIQRRWDGRRWYWCCRSCSAGMPSRAWHGAASRVWRRIRA